MNKRLKRLGRAVKTRKLIKETNTVRLAVYRSPQHIYAQIISSCGSKTLVSASTVDKEIKKECAYGGNVDAAKVVGNYIAKRAIAAGITNIAFDRSGYKYHGRIKALAEAARESGLVF